jgi:hypothetical protein
MNAENLLPAFKDLLELIQSLVHESKVKRLAKPSMMLMNKWVALDPIKTETGVRMSRTQQQLFQKADWSRASFQILDKIKASPLRQSFQEKLSAAEAVNLDHDLDDAIRKIIVKSFNAEALNANDLLDYFLKKIANVPVPAWSDIEVYGVTVKDIQNIGFTIGNRRFIFRQLDVPDFEKESLVGISSDSRFGVVPPNSILRIEMNAWRPLELQFEAQKATVLLRLFKVCSVRFSRHTWETLSPFAMIVGSGGTMEPIWGANHEIVLTKESGDTLQQFWNSVEPKLPAELREPSSQNVTTVSIAYERYCDSLLSNHPIERKITFAIMGLEAIYLRELEVQELMYRLQLRVCKTLSKLDFKNKEVRSDLKEGYNIRNSYVHGGHLSDKEKIKLEKKGIAVNELAYKLLDYLRISILHLIISKQGKTEFMDLLEDSFIEKSRDDELQSIFKSEETILRI